MAPPTRILIIDDEASIRHSLSEFLDDYDFEVASVESGEEALQLLSGQPFDIAIVDIRLPGISGEVLIQEIHTLLPDMLFLIHTGSVDYALSRELEDIGIQPEHIHIKPLPDLIVIVESIQKIIRRAKSPGL